MNKEFEGAAPGSEELEAAADPVSKEEPVDVSDISFVINLSKTYDFDGEKIKSIDMSKLADLTTVDAQSIDRVMNRMQHHPQQKFRDTLYTKHIAMRVTGLPVEFFDQLRWKDMNEVTNIITLYFFGLLEPAKS